MGIQTMGSQQVDSTQQQSQSIASLGRVSSLYSLTLDEVQTHLGNLGKPLGSMNLDELLRNIQSSENAAPASSQGACAATTSKKTVDQVWADIQNGDTRAQHHRELTLGEVTLEDFLAKAGVVTQDKNKLPSSVQQQQNHWAQQFQLSSVQQQQNMMGIFMPGCTVPQPVAICPNPHLEVDYPDNQMAMSSPPLMSGTQITGCKRSAKGDGKEKTTDRRQKRMIKNRESAAKSRERKQAHTTELEIKVALLEEENERLRKHQELKKKMLQCAPPPEPKFQLRRTSSADF